MSSQNSVTNLVAQLSESSLTVISHDAGGANVLEAFIRAHNLRVENFILGGPAIQIFNSLSIDKKNYPTKKFEVILASTGWQTDFEIKQISSARARGKRVIVFLDHWTNFDQRLRLETSRVFVSEIVTFDEKALKIASEVFLESKIFSSINYYLQEQAMLVTRLRQGISEPKFDFLFIGEPIRDKSYLEEDAFQFFLAKIAEMGSSTSSIAVRPHPSQRIEKYYAMVSRNPNCSIQITQHTTLFEDLSNAKAIFGCYSMALEVAKMAKIPVYSAIPETN